MVWGVIRLFASEPPELLQPSTPVLNGSAGVDGGPASKPQLASAPAAAPKPMPVTLVGAQDGSHVVVRDRTGKVVWAGEVVLGEKRMVKALPPVKVEATVGGAIEAYVKGIDRGPVGARRAARGVDPDPPQPLSRRRSAISPAAGATVILEDGHDCPPETPPPPSPSPW